MKRYHRTYFACEPTTIFQQNETWLFGRELTLHRMPNGDLLSLIYSGGRHSQPWQADAEEPPPWICHPHGFANAEKELLCRSCETIDMHYLFKVPFRNFPG